ncbi:MAG: hypothetical protein ACLVAV_13590 [Clostridium sp.]
MAKQKKPVHRVEMTEGKGTSSASFSKNTISRPQKISRMHSKIFWAAPLKK